MLAAGRLPLLYVYRQVLVLSPLSSLLALPGHRDWDQGGRHELVQPLHRPLPGCQLHLRQADTAGTVNIFGISPTGGIIIIFHKIHI